MLQMFYHYFLFMRFSMCHYAVNWCDKLRFFLPFTDKGGIMSKT